MSYSTPILIITFNRPDHTRQVWEEIKNQKPKQVFVFQDGARVGNELDIEKCAEVRAVFEENLDWECDLQTFYSEENLGCGKGPASAITWFFEHVEEGLIIEDDAIPAPDFFLYAEELLERYRGNYKVKAIGSMKIGDEVFGEDSYYFSMMNRTLCAWATWKRAWNGFNYYMMGVSKKELSKAMVHYKATLREREYWIERLAEIQKDALNETSWDQQFWMGIWLNHGVGIVPNVNLSSNIGFDEFATHTTNSDSVASKVPVENILPLSHPKNIKIYRKADLLFHKRYFNSYEYGLTGFKRLPMRINKRIKRLVGHEGSWFKK